MTKKCKMIEVPIGGVIERFGKKYRCVKVGKVKVGEACSNCDFKYLKRVCETVKCYKYFRADKEYVIFREVKQ